MEISSNPEMDSLDKKLERLGTLPEQEVSPFLFTRIKARLDKEQSMRIRPGLAWTLIATAFILLFAEVELVWKPDRPLNPVNELAREMNLNPGNTLYP